MLFWYRWRQPIGNASSRLPYSQIHPSRTLRSSSPPSACAPPSPYQSQSFSRHRVRCINLVSVYCSLPLSPRPLSVVAVNVSELTFRSTSNVKRHSDRIDRLMREAVLHVDQTGQSWREDNIRWRKGAMQWRRQKKVTHVIGSSNHVLLLARYQDGTAPPQHSYT